MFLQRVKFLEQVETQSQDSHQGGGCDNQSFIADQAIRERGPIQEISEAFISDEYKAKWI